MKLNNHIPVLEFGLIATTITRLFNQLKWTPSDQLGYIRRRYGKNVLSQLKIDELKELRKYLESIPQVGDKVAIKRDIRLVSTEEDVTIPQGTIGTVIDGGIVDKNYIILSVGLNGKNYTIGELIGIEPTPPGCRDEARKAHTIILEDILSSSYPDEDIRAFCHELRESLDSRFGDGSKLLNESSRALAPNLREKLKAIMSRSKPKG